MPKTEQHPVTMPIAVVRDTYAEAQVLMRSMR